MKKTALRLFLAVGYVLAVSFTSKAMGGSITSHDLAIVLTILIGVVVVTQELGNE